jgi:hypothetical protein
LICKWTHTISFSSEGRLVVSFLHKLCRLAYTQQVCSAVFYTDKLCFPFRCAQVPPWLHFAKQDSETVGIESAGPPSRLYSHAAADPTAKHRYSKYKVQDGM